MCEAKVFVTSINKMAQSTTYASSADTLEPSATPHGVGDIRRHQRTRRLSRQTLTVESRAESDLSRSEQGDLSRGRRAMREGFKTSQRTNNSKMPTNTGALYSTTGKPAPIRTNVQKSLRAVLRAFASESLDTKSHATHCHLHGGTSGAATAEHRQVTSWQRHIITTSRALSCSSKGTTSSAWTHRQCLRPLAEVELGPAGDCASPLGTVCVLRRGECAGRRFRSWALAAESLEVGDAIISSTGGGVSELLRNPPPSSANHSSPIAVAYVRNRHSM